jgi:hypothetical protein
MTSTAITAAELASVGQADDRRDHGVVSASSEAQVRVRLPGCRPLALALLEHSVRGEQRGADVRSMYRQDESSTVVPKTEPAALRALRHRSDR